MSKRLVSFLLTFIMIIGSFTPVFADGIIISGGSEDKIVGENNIEELKSSITINNQNDKDKKQDETPSSLVIDNNNTETENKLEISDEKKPEAQKADDNVPPAKDFNEEITEFKQYARNITKGQPETKFEGEVNYYQTPNETNIIEHKFILKTRPLSRDYGIGELAVDLTGIEKTRKYLDIENGMRGNSVTYRKLIINDSEFFKSSTSEINNHTKNPILKYCTKLKNSRPLKKGETIDIAYTYQEYMEDIYLQHGKQLKSNIYINDVLMDGAALINYYSEETPLSGYPYKIMCDPDNITSYSGTYLGQEYGYSGKEYRNIYNYDPYTSFRVDKTRKTPGFINAEGGLIADIWVSTGQPYSRGFSTRSLMMFDGVNGIFPTFSMVADKDLIYLKTDGTVEKYPSGKEIVLAENGKVIRDLGFKKSNIDEEKKETGMLFVERDKNEDTTVRVQYKLKNTHYKDSEQIIPEVTITKIEYDVKKKPPVDNAPRIKNFCMDLNRASFTEFLAYKDLLAGVNLYFSPSSFYGLYYNFINDTDQTTDKAARVIRAIEVIYNKTNPTEIYTYETSNLTSNLNSGSRTISPFSDGEAGHSRGFIFKDIENAYKKLDPEQCSKGNYAAKRIYVIEDNGGQNGNPFFSNIKNFDNYSELPDEIKNSLGSDMAALREKKNTIIIQADDDISLVPMIHFSGGRSSDFKVLNGYKMGECVIFNSTNSTIANFQIFSNLLAKKDDSLEMLFEITLPKDIIYIGTPRIKVNGQKSDLLLKNPPKVINANGESKILVKITNSEINNINNDKLKPESRKNTIIDGYTNKILVELPGHFIINQNIADRFNGEIKWDKDCIMTASVTTKIDNLKVYTANSVDFQNCYFAGHIAKPSRVEQTDNEKYTYIYNGYGLYDPATTLDYYTKTKIAYEKSPEFIAGIFNSVKGPEDQYFTVAPKPINFKDFYENKITVQTASTPMTDVVIYNDIENANPGFLNWKGTLKNIDLSELTNQGFVVETYINRAKHSKNIKEDSWKKYNGSEDLSDVKSLAFKIMDKNGKPGVLPKESEYSIVLKMQAPSEDKVPKADGKPTHSYSKVFTDWRSVNDNTMSGAESFTVKLSMVGSITDDIIAKVNHKININRTYSDGFTDKGKEENNIVILTDIKTGNKYMTSGNTLACVEPGKYNVSYITKKGVIADGDKTIEIIEEYKDSLNTINVSYSKSNDQGSGDGPGYVDEDSKENLFKITVKEKKIIHIR